jgi:aminoglycoside phosphotransferase (APT) family kinase protein
VNQEEIYEITCLVEAFAPGARLLSQRSLTGGVSARTNALELEHTDGSRERVVVRIHGDRDLARDPEIARHEYQLLDALWQSGLPVPKPIAVVEAVDQLKTPAVVMEFIEGEIKTAAGSLPSARSISEMAYWLARIHAFDLTSTDLSFLIETDYGNPDRFRVSPDDSETAQRICDRLSSIEPATPRNQSVLLHGDYWRGNLLWVDDQIVGIIDWEDAFIGDPIIDLARSRLELFWTYGVLPCERFTTHYLSRNDIDTESLAWWDLAMALGFARVLSGWGLPDEREQQMTAALAQFVTRAEEQLAIQRHYP